MRRKLVDWNYVSPISLWPWCFVNIASPWHKAFISIFSYVCWSVNSLGSSKAVFSTFYSFLSSCATWENKKQILPNLMCPVHFIRSSVKMSLIGLSPWYEILINVSESLKGFFFFYLNVYTCICVCGNRLKLCFMRLFLVDYLDASRNYVTMCNLCNTQRT